MARSTWLMILIKNKYILRGRNRFFLPVTYSFLLGSETLPSSASQLSSSKCYILSDKSFVTYFPTNSYILSDESDYILSDESSVPISDEYSIPYPTNLEYPFTLRVEGINMSPEKLYNYFKKSFPEFL